MDPGTGKLYEVVEAKTGQRREVTAGIRAPTLQPCGHPWKAQHDFKCILCSAPGDATYAQLAEEQRFLHGAAAVTGLTQQDYDALVRDAMLWRTRSPTGAGGNARAFMCCEGVGQHAPGCIAQEAARCNCDLPMPVNSVDGDGLAWCITCGFNIGTTP